MGDNSVPTPEQDQSQPLAGPDTSAPPVLPIPASLPSDPTLAGPQPSAAPNSAVTGLAGPLSAALSNPANGKQLSFNDKVQQGANAAAATLPPGQAAAPGSWARSLIAGVTHAMGSVQDALGDAAASTPKPGAGIAGMIGAQRNAETARLQAAKKAANADQAAQDEHQTHLLTNANLNVTNLLHQQVLHQQSDEMNHKDVADGIQQIAAMTTEQSKLGLEPAKTIASKISEDQLNAGIKDHSIDPTTMQWIPDGTIQPLDPKTGKPAVDEHGDPVHQKTFTVLQTPKTVALTKDNADLINKYIPGVHFDYDPDHPQILPGAQASALVAQARQVETFQSTRDLELAKAGLEKLTVEQEKASQEALKKLAGDQDYTKAKGHLPNDLSKVYQWMTGQYPEYGPDGKPTGKIDKGSLQAAQDNPTAGTDLITAYGGQKGFDGIVEKQAEDQEKIRKDNQIEQHNQRMEEIAAQKEADKRQAAIVDHTDVFGNKSPVADKEFDKRYDQFTSSTQNKTLQTLAGSYDQFQSILGDIAQGKLTAPESLVGLFDAIGISATPLAGKGFRISNNVINEHIGARGLDQAAISKLQGITTGQVITNDQMKDYAKIALDVYKSAYIKAANEQKRTLGYVDILPRGNNQPIDPVTASLYLKVANNDPGVASQAAEKSGWQATPANFQRAQPSSHKVNDMIFQDGHHFRVDAVDAKGVPTKATQVGN